MPPTLARSVLSSVPRSHTLAARTLRASTATASASVSAARPRAQSSWAAAIDQAKNLVQDQLGQFPASSSASHPTASSSSSSGSTSAAAFFGAAPSVGAHHQRPAVAGIVGAFVAAVERVVAIGLGPSEPGYDSQILLSGGGQARASAHRAAHEQGGQRPLAAVSGAAGAGTGVVGAHRYGQVDRARDGYQRAALAGQRAERLQPAHGEHRGLAAVVRGAGWWGGGRGARVGVGSHPAHTAILGGDFLLGRASVALARLRDAEVVELLATVIANLVEGEVMQLKSQAAEAGDAAKGSHAHVWDTEGVLAYNMGLSPDQAQSSAAGAAADQPTPAHFSLYLQKTYLKTAALIAKSTRASVILAGCGGDAISKAGLDSKTAHHMRQIRDAAYGYGRNLGIAFQLVDDLLDFQSTSAAFGKPSGGADLRLGLATAPVLYAWQELPRRGIQRTAELAKEHARRAKEHLEVLPDSDAKQALIRLNDQQSWVCFHLSVCFPCGSGISRWNFCMRRSHFFHVRVAAVRGSFGRKVEIVVDVDEHHQTVGKVEDAHVVDARAADRGEHGGRNVARCMVVDVLRHPATDRPQCRAPALLGAPLSSI
ncbi:hypothetical protein L1887_59622 [Cichorium endivia]|nr:hypothetical protein L1887_59622 [Cichorium endivia]